MKACRVKNIDYVCVLGTCHGEYSVIFSFLNKIKVKFNFLILSSLCFLGVYYIADNNFKS